MRQPNNREREIIAGMNHQQILSLEEMHNQMLPSSNFDPSNDDFLEQMLSSVPSSAFTWAADEQPEKMRLQQQIMSNGAAAKALMLPQQLTLLSTHNVDASSLSPTSANLTNDASIKAFLNGFTGSLGQTSNQPHHFHHPQAGGGALQQSQSLGAPAAAASGSSGEAAAGQPRQPRVRARRGQATDPHSIAERLRRERIAERMKSLQELVPNANKTDKASMLDEIIDYLKFLQLQVKVLSMSRLGGAAAVAPLVAERKSGNVTQTASSSNNKEGMTVTEQQVANLMEEDMGSAMQYLQGKGLCLMPISLATAISTRSNPLTSNHNNPLLKTDAGGPPSPSVSVLTVQSATIGRGEKLE